MLKPNVRQSFLHLLQLSWKHYFPLLKASLIYILAIVIVKDVSQLFYDRLESFYVDLGVNILVGLLLVFFWSCSLRASDLYFKGQSPGAKQILIEVLKLFPSILGALLGFIIIFVIFFMFAHAVGKQSLVIEFSLFMLPVFFLFVLFFFAVPNVILHNTSIIGAFRESAENVGFENWLHTFGLYALVLFTWLLVSPSTLHEHVLANYYLNAPFDFIILSLLLPMLNSMVVLSDNDFRIS
jgi:hypothetical protein